MILGRCSRGGGRGQQRDNDERGERPCTPSSDSASSVPQLGRRCWRIWARALNIVERTMYVNVIIIALTNFVELSVRSKLEEALYARRESFT